MRYKVGHPIEEGENISVFSLHDTLEPAHKLILTQLPEPSGSGELVELAKAIDFRTSLRHPSLPAILDLTFRGKNPGLVSERIDHPSLESLIGRITWNETLGIAVILADLLHQLHQKGFRMGYLSPRKVFIDSDGRPLLNFLLSHGDLHPEASLYSRLYAAQEYLESGKATQAGDNYSLGVLLYELLSGSYPFHYTSSQDLARRKQSVIPSLPAGTADRISPEARASLASLIHPDPEMRISANRIARDLEKHCGDVETVPLPFTTEVLEREKEIGLFIEILTKREESLTVVLLSGSRGIGKTRLGGVFQLCARLHRFRTDPQDALHLVASSTNDHTPGNNDRFIYLEHPGFEEFKILVEGESSRTGRLILVVESGNSNETHRFVEYCQKLGDKARFNQIHLRSLTRRSIDRISPFRTAAGRGRKFLNELGELADGRPGTALSILNSFAEKGTLVWKEGQWRCGDTATPEEDIQTLLDQNIGELVQSLPEHQKLILQTLAIYSQPIPVQLVSEILNITEIYLSNQIELLVETGLVRLKGSISNPSAELVHPGVAVAVRKNISRRESARIHRILGRNLESLYEKIGDLSLLYKTSLHYINAGLSPRAAKHLNSAVDYLTRNSSYQNALRLFRAGISKNLYSLSLPENWITYLKLLLKTGRERECRDFLETRPGFDLNNIILFRIGHTLESLDLEAEEICPHLSEEIHGVFQPPSLSRTIKVSMGRKGATERGTHTLNLETRTFTRRSSHETSRCCHQLSCLHREMGKIEMAIRYELKSFRSSLALNKHVAAARKLLNLCEMLIEEGRLKPALSWLQYCIAMARETGDLKTDLLAQLLLAEIDRRNSQILEAEISVAWVREQNNTHCGSRRILTATLLQEARNLISRNKPDLALLKISELTSNKKYRNHKFLWDETRLLEITALVSIEEYDKAVSILKKTRFMDRPDSSIINLKAKILQAEICLKRGNHSHAANLVREILRHKNFLPIESLAKLRIAMARLSLAKHNPTKAVIYINHAEKLVNEASPSSLQAEVFLVKTECLARIGEFKRAWVYYLRTARLAHLACFQFAGHLSHLLCRRGLQASSFPDSPNHHQELTRFTRLLGKTTGSIQIEQELLKQVRRCFPSGFPSFCCEKYRKAASPAELGFSEMVNDGGNLNQKLFAGNPRSGPKARETKISFPVGHLEKSDSVLQATLPPGFFLRQDEYDFIKHLSELPSIQQKSSAFKLSPVFTNQKASLVLRDGREIIGTSKVMQQIKERLLSVADLKTTVLLQGESGTGKELMARGLHDFSIRKEGPFIAVNCASLPPELVENELFGHARGSYTGADTASKGLFEAASGGTIFLDEISTLSPELQPRLLRVIENKTIRPLGSIAERRVDVRIVAASNQDLRELVKERIFREDLFYRLDALRIEIPPLRNRKEDIRHICLHFLRTSADELRKEISADALEKLTEHDYPGNVRELLNIMENLICFSSSNSISVSDVEKSISFKHSDKGISGRRPAAENILSGLARGETDFWAGVRTPFINREINRSEVKEIVAEGLKECGGSYKKLLEFFNLPSSQYKKFLSFLEHHDCKVDFRPFRRNGA